MFPIRDENPVVRPPIATIALVGLNIASWVFIQGFGSHADLTRSLCLYGLIPGDLLGTASAGISVPLGPDAVCILDGSGSFMTPITSMFMHGGWFHIIGNLWFLWVFGDNVEDSMGVPRFLLFYLLCGLGAALAQVITDPDSVVPMVGASGAIGGVMGAYARLYPRARIHTAVFFGFFFTTFSISAVAMLGYWFLIQVLGGLPALAGASSGIAFWAHVGGFVAGLILAGPFHRPAYLEEHRRQLVRRSVRDRRPGRGARR
jgi:membrane associated rhomboid family serine protease